MGKILPIRCACGSRRREGGAGCFYIVQKKVTRKGTLRSTVMPWTMEITTNSLPQNLVMMGNVVSAVVAPPTEMGANFPK